MCRCKQMCARSSARTLRRVTVSGSHVWRGSGMTRAPLTCRLIRSCGTLSTRTRELSQVCTTASPITHFTSACSSTGSQFAPCAPSRGCCSLHLHHGWRPYDFLTVLALFITSHMLPTRHPLPPVSTCAVCTRNFTTHIAAAGV